MAAVLHEPRRRDRVRLGRWRAGPRPARTCDSRRRRSSGRSPAQQRRERRAGLIELALQRCEPGLEFVLPKLGDHFALGDLLAFLDGSFTSRPGT